MPRPRSRCTRTGKAKYPDSIEAGIAMSKVQANQAHKHRSGVRDTPTRVYRCEFCDHWHMTSQEQRSSDSGN